MLHSIDCEVLFFSDGVQIDVYCRSSIIGTWTLHASLHFSTKQFKSNPPRKSSIRGLKSQNCADFVSVPHEKCLSCTSIFTIRVRG